MKKIFYSIVAILLAACSGSDEGSSVQLYLTSDGVQKPFFAEAVNNVDADGQPAVLVYADRDNQQLNFDVAADVTGENVVEHLEFVPDLEQGTVFGVSDVFYSEVTVNSGSRLKGNFSGNVTDGETELYIECRFDVRN